MMNAHVIEHRAHVMNREIWKIWNAGLGLIEERAAIAEAEKAAGYRHGWYFDEMAGAVFQNNGGRGIVWVDQPVMD